MKELQGLLHDTNICLNKHGVDLQTALIQTGMIYCLPNTALGMNQATGRIEKLTDDYQGKQEGIGIVVPEMKNFSSMLTAVQAAASKVMEIQAKHTRTMHDMTWLCFNHIKHKFPWEDTTFRGWLFRIQITAKTATFQILFLVWHGLYAPSHEIKLSEIVEGDAFEEEPFSQMPLNMLIPASDRSWTYVPATYQGWKAMLDDIPLNSKKKTTQMYRSYTADVLKDFQGMVEELMAA